MIQALPQLVSFLWDSSSSDLVPVCPFLSLSVFNALAGHSTVHQRSHSQLFTPLVSLTLQSHERTREGLRHLASLKFETWANIAIVSICSLLLWKVTSKWVLIYGRGLELIVLLHCLLPSYSDCGPLSGHLYWVLLVFW